MPKISPIKQLADAHDDGIWAAAWAPPTDARPQAVLLTGSVDESVRVWAGDDLTAARTNSGHTLGVVAIAACPTTSRAASSSLDCFVRVFDVDSNATIATLEAPPAETWHLAFHPQGSFLAVAGGSSQAVKLWSTATWQEATTLDLPAGPAAPATAGGSNSSSSTTLAGRFVLSVAWSVDGKRLACSSMDGTVAIFDTSASPFRFLHFLEGHHLPVRSLAFSPIDPRILVTASDDRHTHVYDVEGRQLIAALSGHTSWVLSADCSPDGATIATAPHTQHLTAALSGHTSWVLSAADCSPVGATICTDAPAIKQLQRSNSEHVDMQQGTALQVARENKDHQVWGSSDRTVALWDMRQRTALHVAKDHKDHAPVIEQPPPPSRPILPLMAHAPVLAAQARISAARLPVSAAAHAPLSAQAAALLFSSFSIAARALIGWFHLLLSAFLLHVASIAASAASLCISPLSSLLHVANTNAVSPFDACNGSPHDPLLSADAAAAGGRNETQKDNGRSCNAIGQQSPSLLLYGGHVAHHRSHPTRHGFNYAVRYALVNLDAPPDWFSRSSARHHMSADEARSFAGTDGPM
ncbi:unnamed protein product [Closterium sp. Naga37s-1]|nr:unnamed protein product [Closterium sp. Naga37s-1]